MVIECESCGTRFNLADGQVPPQGARVRCSKCHHRFHVMPDGAPAAGAAKPAAGSEAKGMPALPVDDTPHPAREASPPAQAAAAPEPEPEPIGEAEPEPEPIAEAEPEPEPIAEPPPEPEPTAKPAQARHDSELENPEFLFDSPQTDSGPDSGFELAVGSSQDPLGEDDNGVLGDPDADGPDTQSPLDDADDAEHVRAQVFGIESGTSPADVGAKIIDAEPEAGADSFDDSGISAWDGAEEVSADDWESVLGDSDEAEPAPSPVAESGSAREPERPAAKRAPAAPTEVDLGSAGQRAAQTAMHTTALAIGLLLVLGGLRVLVSHGLGATPGPEVVRANGWTASDIDAVQLRDAFGGRVLVLRGSLIPEGQQRPPELQVTLLDLRGNSLQASGMAHLERLDRSELAPEALSTWLLRGMPRRSLAGSGAPVTGFTVLIPDPPEAARRFQIDLLSAAEAI